MACSTSRNTHFVYINPTTFRASKSKPKDGAIAVAAASGAEQIVGRSSQPTGEGVTPCAMSPLSQEGRSPNPDPHFNPPATNKPDQSGKNLPPHSAPAFPLGTEGNDAGAKEVNNVMSGGASLTSHDNVSQSTLSTMTVPIGEGAAGGNAGRRTDAHGRGGRGGSCESSSKSLAVMAAVQNAAKTLVSNTIDRKHGRTTNGAVVIKVAAWGIEPRLALDKKTHAVLERDTSPVAGAGAGAGATGLSGGGGLEQGGGRQFLKFEAWSTRASAASSPWTVHPSMRRQVGEHQLKDREHASVTQVEEHHTTNQTSLTETKLSPSRRSTPGSHVRVGSYLSLQSLKGQRVGNANLPRISLPPPDTCSPG